MICILTMIISGGVTYYKNLKHSEEMDSILGKKTVQ